MRLFDTSIVLKLLKNGRRSLGSISMITLMEILRGIPQERRVRIKILLEDIFSVVKLNNEVILSYCNLYDWTRNTGQTLPDADLLIAATAISQNIPLVTFDNDFNRLEEQGLLVSSQID